MVPQPAYTVHEADLERDRELIVGLWRGNLGEDARMARKYDWFYRPCPYGAPLTLLLRHAASGEWVGVASAGPRSEEHTSELQSLMRISYAVFCLTQTTKTTAQNHT